MAKVKTSPEITDMLEELKKFFAEVTGIVLFGLRLGAIQENLEACSEIATLMSEVEKINDRILQTDGPIYPKDAYITIKESQVNDIISLILAHLVSFMTAKQWFFEGAYSQVLFISTIEEQTLIIDFFFFRTFLFY